MFKCLLILFFIHKVFQKVIVIINVFFQEGFAQPLEHKDALKIVDKLTERVQNNFNALSRKKVNNVP